MKSNNTIKILLIVQLAVLISLQSFAESKEKAKKAEAKSSQSSAFVLPEAEKPTPTELAFDAVATNPLAVLVKVDGSPITQADLDKELAVLKNMFEKQMGSSGKESPFTMLLPKMKPQILDSLITKKIIDNACKKHKIEISDAEVKKEIETIKAMLPKNMKLEDLMKRQNITQDEFEKEIAQQLKIEKLVGVQEPSEKEIADFYEKAADAFSHPETVRARHILIKTEATDTEAQKKEKRKKAEDLRKKLKEGANFADLARENSDCPSKVNGGDLNEFARGEMVKSFEDVAFQLKDNEISDVVETEYGYHIIQTLAHNQPYKESLEEAKGKIIMRLKMTQLREKMPSYLEKLRSEAKIEYVSIPEPEVSKMPKLDDEKLSDQNTSKDKGIPETDINKKDNDKKLDL